jgi:hypothetical protein
MVWEIIGSKKGLFEPRKCRELLLITNYALLAYNACSVACFGLFLK